METQLSKLLDDAVKSKSSLLLPGREESLFMEVQSYFRNSELELSVLGNKCIKCVDLGDINDAFLREYDRVMLEARSAILFDIWTWEHAWIRFGLKEELLSSFKYMNSLFRNCFDLNKGKIPLIGIINYFTYPPLLKKEMVGVLRADQFADFYKKFDIIYDGYLIIDLHEKK